MGLSRLKHQNVCCRLLLVTYIKAEEGPDLLTDIKVMNNINVLVRPTIGGCWIRDR